MTMPLATPKQIKFMRVLMYERLEMSDAEIDEAQLDRFTIAEASTCISEWLQLPQARMAPAPGAAPAAWAPPAPAPATATATAPATATATATATAPTTMACPPASARVYECYKCGASIVGYHALKEHKERVHSYGARVAPRPAEPTAPAARVPMPDPGRYAVLDAEGVWRFYRVTTKRVSNQRYMVRQSGSRFVMVGATEREMATELIKRDPNGAMRQYGIKLGHCGKCGRELTDPESRARGIGPDCWSRMP